MAKKKSLQKFTNIDKINTKEHVREFLKENPKDKELLRKEIIHRLNTSYAEKLGNENMLINLLDEFYLITKGKNSPELISYKNATYEANHLYISSCIHNSILENRRFPSIGNIAEETGLSRQTIYKHLDAGLQNKFNRLVRSKIEYMTTSAMEKLYLIGVQDNNATALKHFIQLSGVANNNTTNVNNYIQINNIKITNEDFSKLPQQDILEIESILAKTIKVSE